MVQDGFFKLDGAMSVRNIVVVDNNETNHGVRWQDYEESWNEEASFDLGIRGNI